MSRIVTIDRDAAGPFASLASESWFRATDDHAPDPALGDWPEVYYRAGMLNALQLVLSASRHPKSPAGKAVVAAMEVAAEMLTDESEPRP